MISHRVVTVNYYNNLKENLICDLNSSSIFFLKFYSNNFNIIDFNNFNIICLLVAIFFFLFCLD